MSVTQSDTPHELSPQPALPVAAIVYADEVYPDALFRTLVERCRAQRMTISGVMQHQAAACDVHHCDVILEDLASGHRTALFENRGTGARGCRLDEAALAEASARIEASLDPAPGLLVLNKFGKAESEGRGLRDLIASAIDRGIPVVIGVPKRNVGAWRDFAGGFAVELSGGDAVELQRWLDGLA